MKNFLDISSQYSDFENSKAVVISFPFEKSTTFGKGTKFGPKAIISASGQVELFDEELEREAYKEIGVATLPQIMPGKTKAKLFDPLVKKVGEVVSKGKFPIILGGEHTISIGGVLGVAANYKTFSVLHFDAHADLRDSYEGNKFSHASAMRRVLEIQNVKNLVSVGIRNISNEKSEGSEFDFYKKNQNKIKIFWAKDKEKWNLDELLYTLDENVYLTFDVDAFDPSIMPSTGTPEPGGLGWYETLKIIRKVASQKKIIGADIVELCPIPGLIAPDFLAAKLAYKIINYVL